MQIRGWWVLGLLPACVSPTDVQHVSAEGKAIMAQKDELERTLDVELRSATVLDGINTNVLKIDMRSSDKTLEERVVTAQKAARLLLDKGAIPSQHLRVAFDFPVSFRVGCMPVSIYERVQLETRQLRPIQALPAQRVMAYDQAIRGKLGDVLLDDAQWNVPFFLNVDAVELSDKVMEVAARPGEVFVTVHAKWTNIGTQAATMSDDVWRLVSTSGANKGEVVGLLDGGSTHLARNGGLVKMAPVEPGKVAGRWYVFRLPRERLASGVAFARQRYAKQTAQDKNWQKAGFEVSVDIKAAHPEAALPESGTWLIHSLDWNAREPVTVPAQGRSSSTDE